MKDTHTENVWLKKIKHTLNIYDYESSVRNVLIRLINLLTLETSHKELEQKEKEKLNET